MTIEIIQYLITSSLLLSKNIKFVKKETSTHILKSMFKMLKCQSILQCLKKRDHLNILNCIKNITNNSIEAKQQFEQMDSTKMILSIICKGFEVLYVDKTEDMVYEQAIDALKKDLELTEQSDSSHHNSIENSGKFTQFDIQNICFQIVADLCLTKESFLRILNNKEDNQLFKMAMKKLVESSS